MGPNGLFVSGDGRILGGERAGRNGVGPNFANGTASLARFSGPNGTRAVHVKCYLRLVRLPFLPSRLFPPVSLPYPWFSARKPNAVYVPITKPKRYKLNLILPTYDGRTN